MNADRFKRIHESIIHWYRGTWSDLYLDPQREKYYGPDKGTKTNPSGRMAHWNNPSGDVIHQDDGKRLIRSLMRFTNLRGRGIHPNEKPTGLLDPLIRYACPPGGLVVDPFAGSGSTLDAARQSGRRAIGIEGHEPYAEKAARRLEQMTLEVS
jgi:site-specific DNA-methyltransferase (adenine-specific)